MAETIHLYHTNDLHSYFENWPKVAHYLKRMKKEHAEHGEEMLLVDVGDHLDRVHPITEATNGKSNVELMNDLEYDAVTIGNNEGITLPHDALDTLYDRAAFPVILSNLYTESGSVPAGWSLLKSSLLQTELELPFLVSASFMKSFISFSDGK